MRYDTFMAGSQFITELQDNQLVRHIYEDGDMMYFSLLTGERIMAYMIERAFTLQNLQHHLSTNTADGRYSLFFLYSDAFLPAHGDFYAVEDWMRALLAVQGGKIYAFEVTGKRAFYFPVYFAGTGDYRQVTHGDLITMPYLHGRTVTTDEPTISGRWRVASFDAPNATDEPPTAQPITVAPLSPLLRAYQTLGVGMDDSLLTIRRAYRELARQYHPDLNPAPQAMIRMKAINAAYLHVMAHLHNHKNL